MYVSIRCILLPSLHGYSVEMKMNQPSLWIIVHLALARDILRYCCSLFFLDTAAAAQLPRAKVSYLEFARMGQRGESP